MKNALFYIRHVLLLLAITAVIVLVWNIPHWLVSASESLTSQELSTFIFETRRSLILTIAAVAALFGLYLIYRRMIAIEKNIQITNEVRIADRFSRAVEQLGTHKLEIQLGGIFMLEKIASESKMDHWIIMEILTAYVRENLPFNREAVDLNDHQKNIENGDDSFKQKRLATNIQAILSVIIRRKWLNEEVEQNHFLNLRKTNLKYADLRNAWLIGANFRGTNLERANLMGANLAGAFLGESNLKNANLLNANLEEADLRKANFEGVKLTGVNFQGANFAGVNIKGADLSESLLKEVNFNNVRLNKIKYDEETLFPEWLNQEKRDKYGMIFELR